MVFGKFLVADGSGARLPAGGVAAVAGRTDAQWTPLWTAASLPGADARPSARASETAGDGCDRVATSCGIAPSRSPGVVTAAPVEDRPAPVSDAHDTLGCDAARGDAPAREVLVVDDSMAARRMLSAVLCDAGYRVRTATDGVDAVDAIEQGVPDLVLIDLEMPRMNGLELTAQLRSRASTARVPLLMVTSHATERHRVRARAAGIDDFITKPYASDALLEQVGALLGLRSEA